MELRIGEMQVPEKISFNYEELKQELVKTLERYEGLVYTPEQMKQAKTDRATLNKLKKALNDERIKREREYMKPFTEFKEQISDLIKAIDKPVSLIDFQVKEYEEQKKCEKRQTIEEMFDSLDTYDWLKLDQLFQPQWLNASVSIKVIEGDIRGMLETISKDLAVLSEMSAFSFEATEIYKQTLNLQRAINEGKRLADIQKRKEEAERLRAESEAKRAAQQEKAVEYEATVEETTGIGEGIQDGGDLPPVVVSESATTTEPEQAKGQWVSFKAFLTVEQAHKLREFTVQNGIELKAI